mmetsp:Transcript_58880/g.164483  ORF Transcript_58880/g.164483 Transcript_58880/m.164483 type:complete len:207 (+) Transcript_58880:543-1163(+)
MERQLDGLVGNPIRREREVAVGWHKGKRPVALEPVQPNAWVERNILQHVRVAQREQHLGKAAELAVHENIPVDAARYDVPIAAAYAIDRLDNVDVNFVRSIDHVLSAPPDLRRRTTYLRVRARAKGCGNGAKGAALILLGGRHVREDLRGVPGDRLHDLADCGGRSDDRLKAVQLSRERQATVDHFVQQQIHDGKILTQGIHVDGA